MIIYLFIFFIELLEHKRFVSSAKWCISECWITSLIPFIYIRNKSGPSIVFSPLKLGRFLVFKIWTKRKVMKKLLRDKGLVEKEGGGVLLWESPPFQLTPYLRAIFSWPGDFQIVSSVFLQKSMFSLLLEYFFLSGKYSLLL